LSNSIVLGYEAGQGFVSGTYVGDSIAMGYQAGEKSGLVSRNW